MSKSFLTNINLNKNELQNAVVQVLASDPGSPVAGQVYFNSTDSRLKQYTGSAWIEYSTATSAGDASTNTATSVDGEVALFSGTTGKLIKRATGSGIAKLTSGVLGTATAGTDYVPATSGSAIQKANGSGGLTAAVSATDYAPATTGTAILKASSGGFANAVSGTDYAPATATTSSLKGNGSGGFAAATLNDNGAPTGDFSMASFKLTNLADPVSAQDASTKAYVDATAAGIDWKASVRAATTANGTLASAYANGSVIDGVTLATNDRILIKNQTTGSENGIYKVNASGAPTRAVDADSNTEVTGGLAVFVEEGTTNADSGWVLTNNGAITLGTTALVFTQFTGLGQVTAGTGLTQTGNTIAIENSGVLLSTHGGTGVATSTGSGNNVLSTSPTLVTPVLGTPTSVTLTNATGLPLTTGVTGVLPAANGGAGTVSGILKANGSGTVSAATAGTDYYNPGGTDVAVADGGTGASTASTARANLGATTKFTATIGDGSTTAIAVTHSLGTQDVICQVRDATSNAVVECDITQTSSAVTTFTFTVAPASNAYKVVIIG